MTIEAPKPQKESAVYVMLSVKVSSGKDVSK
jgi:hypothetical protein